MQVLLKRNPRLEFLACLVVGAVHELYQKWTGISEALKTKAEVPPELTAARLEVCPTCPVYYAPISSCGSPFAENPELGCHCHTKTISGLLYDCWGYTNRKDYGWRRELNSFPRNDE